MSEGWSVVGGRDHMIHHPSLITDHKFRDHHCHSMRHRIDRDIHAEPQSQIHILGRVIRLVGALP